MVAGNAAHGKGKLYQAFIVADQATSVGVAHVGIDDVAHGGARHDGALVVTDQTTRMHAVAIYRTGGLAVADRTAPGVAHQAADVIPGADDRARGFGGINDPVTATDQTADLVNPANGSQR